MKTITLYGEKIKNKKIKCRCGCKKYFWRIDKYGNLKEFINIKHLAKYNSDNRKGKNNPFYGKHHDKKTKKYIGKCSKNMLNGKTVLEFNGEKAKKNHRKSRSKYMINQWKNIKFRKERLKSSRKGMERRPTSPEKKIIEIINKNKLPFKYIGDGSWWLATKDYAFNPDFKYKKKLIEVFGDYWHNRKDAIDRDFHRFKLYKKKGYKCLKIWEKEINNTPLKVEKKLIDFFNIIYI